jgi:hypothetical protein
MRVVYTDEMRKLMKIYEPYMEGIHLVKDAPQEAVEAKRKFEKLFDEAYENNERLL